LFQQNRFDLNAPNYNSQNLHTGFVGTAPKVRNRITGATLYDVVSMWNDRIKLLFNFRFNDQFQQSGLPVATYQNSYVNSTSTTDPAALNNAITANRNAFQTIAAGSLITRRYGGTFEPIKDVMVYYNIGQAFIFNGGVDWQNKPLVPSVGENKEIGVKATFLDGALAVSATHLDITLDNVRIVFIQGPSDPFPGSSSIAQGGTQTNKGYDFAANVSKRFELGTVNMILTDYMGDLRDETGNKVQHVVNNTTSIWGTFNFDNAPLKGLRVGLGTNFTGERVGPATVGQAAGGVHPTRIAPYWKARGMIAYNMKHFGIQLNVDNITDKKAIIGWESSLWIHTDPGRTWRLSGNYNF